MSTALSIARLLMAATLALPACDRSGEQPRPEVSTGQDRRTPGEPLPHDGKALGPDEQRRVADLTALVLRYYPVWSPERESANDYFERRDSSPETARLEALIRQEATDSRVWQACLREIAQNLEPELAVRDGNPPMFYIPSFQVVIHGKHPAGNLTMVFRLSMLAPLYDYYERVRDPVTRASRMSVHPTRETAAVAEMVRGILARHYPAYRALPPELGAARVPGVITLDPTAGAELLPRNMTLAELLFENIRRW